MMVYKAVTVGHWSEEWGQIPNAPSRNHVESLLSMNCATSLEIAIDGTPVGFCILTATDLNELSTIQVVLIYIKPEHRHSEVVRALTGSIRSVIRSVGLSHITMLSEGKYKNAAARLLRATPVREQRLSLLKLED